MTTIHKILPTEKQLDYQDWEFGLFLHFGLRTFYEGYVDFDERPMSPSKFNPTNLDCEQWIRTAKESGMNYAVLTAKHHDGLSNWPSAYTSFSVAQSEWKEGKGDVIREFVDACHKYGIKPGLYYSPYDGSVDFYKKDAKAYDDYFVNQLTELLSNYGEIDILWLDGCGSEGHEYDWPRIIGEVRRLQPNILLNMGDPDFRWVGNEDGVAPVPSWNVVSATEFSILTEEKNQLGEPRWLPAEADVQMRTNWFYSDNDEHTIKSIQELIGLYYHSVGRGVNLLLNIGPNREGVLPRKDTEQLLEMGMEIRRRFDHPIGTFHQCKNEDKKWFYKPEEPQILDHVVIREDLSKGENVLQFKISVITAKSHQRLTIYEGKNIGHKAIIRFPAVKVRGVILEITESDGTPVIKDMLFYHVGE
jgi:alpha-L-fucosidase